MRLAAEAGDTSGALKAYADLYALLDREFDTEPSDFTQALVADIKRGLLTPTPTPTPAPALAPASWAAPTIPCPAPSAPLLRDGTPRVAVLPLRTIGNAPVPPCFQNGLVDDVVRTLARLREPVVISSNSTRHLQGDDFDHGWAAAQLGERLPYREAWQRDRYAEQLLAAGLPD